MIRPYKRPPEPKGVALLIDPGRILTESGELVAIDRYDPQSVTVYARREVGETIARRGEGTLVFWNGKAIAWVPTCESPTRSGPKTRRVSLIRDVLPPDDLAAMTGLAAWAEWVRTEGGVPRSLGSTSESILRATIREPLWTGAGTRPPIRVMVGGRQESNRGPGPIPGPLRLWDLRAAYAGTLARTRYGGVWIERDPHRRQLPEAVSGPVFAHATVHLPGGPGALVRRPRTAKTANRRAWAHAFDWNGTLAEHVYPSRGRITGTWTGAELAAARRSGARVVIDRYWYHAADGFPFARWWAAIERGRDLPGLAGALAKATGNALWGRFAVTDGTRELATFAPGGREVSSFPLPGGGRPRAIDLAEHVTGTIRAELFDLIASAGDRLLCAHTDGAWCFADDDWRPPHAGWRSKDVADAMDYLGPQMLAFRKPGELTPRYRMAGVPAERQAVAFEECWKAMTGDRRTPPIAHVWPTPGRV